ncbi:MAG: hypothetical protein WBO46_27330 [Caldilineaceae bacterium]
MFYQMLLDLQNNAYRLPLFISYNGGDIPFAYAPFTFYLGALLSDFTPISLLQILQYFPAVMSIASLCAFLWLSNTILASPEQAAFATLIFALVPRTYNWEIMGGGLTRSPGFFFALLTIGMAYRLYRHPTPTRIVLTGLFGTLAVLSHLEMGVAAGVGSILCYLVYGRKRQSIRSSLIVTAIVLAGSSPWWVSILANHGIGPFWAAAHTGHHSWLNWLSWLSLSFSQEPFGTIATVVGLLGIFTLIAERRYFLPLWFIVIFLVDPRKAATLSIVPLSMAVGYFLSGSFLPGLRAKGFSPRLGTVFLSIVTLSMLLSSLAAATPAWDNPMQVLPLAEREAMVWVRQNTPSDSQFVMVTSTPEWPSDAASEWFPVLAARRSLSTVQGTEWLPNGLYEMAIERYDDLQICASEGAGCVQEWSASNDIQFTHIYISKTAIHYAEGRNPDCCIILRKNLSENPDYQVIYDGPGAMVLSHNPRE